MTYAEQEFKAEKQVWAMFEQKTLFEAYVCFNDNLSESNVFRFLSCFNQNRLQVRGAASGNRPGLPRALQIKFAD
jgi:hypothetical protein